MTTTTLRLSHRIARLPQLRQIVRGGLAARGSIGAGLAAKAGGAAADWWAVGGAPTPYAVWQPKGAASLAASYLRIAGGAGYANIDPAVVGGVAPTLGATGWIFTKALGTYLKTGVVPATGWTQLIRYVQTNSDVASPCEAGDSTSNGFGLRMIPGSNLFVLLHGSGGVLGPYYSSAVLAQAGRQAYINGVAQGSPAGDASFTTSRELYIGGSNTAATPQILFTGSIAAYAIWDTSTNHATWMPAVMAAAATL